VGTRLRIGTVKANSTYFDTFSRYRVIGPLAELRKIRDIEVVPIEQASWNTMRMLDILFISKPYTQAHLALINMARAEGAKVWIDVDDDYFSVPTYMRNYDQFHTVLTKGTIRKCYNSADVITVSNEHLAARLKIEGVTSPIELSPNVYPYRPEALAYDTLERPKSKLIVWRGDESHMQGLATQGLGLARFLTDNREYKLFAYGAYPWPLVDLHGASPSSIFYRGYLDFDDYFTELRNIKPDIHVRVLDAHKFHHSRSKCAWFEAAHSGAHLVAPWTKEFDGLPGTHHYSALPQGPGLYDTLKYVIYFSALPSSVYREHLFEKNLTRDAQAVNLNRIIQEVLKC